MPGAGVQPATPDSIRDSRLRKQPFGPWQWSTTSSGAMRAGSRDMAANAAASGRGRPAARSGPGPATSVVHFRTARAHNGDVNNEQVPAFKPLTGIFEPSAIQQLPDGRFLIVEDEKRHPLSLVNISADGSVESTALTAGLFQMFSAFWKLDDLEGLALDRAGFVYGITSHSRDDDGDEKKSREKLVRFRVEGKRVVDPRVVNGLKPALTSRHAVLAAAAQVSDVKANAGLNIEALEITPDQKRLLIGFRSPLRDGRALVASVENPSAIFESDEAPRIAALLDELDLGGHGIRGMSYVPAIGDYLVIGGPTSRESASFDLWRWSGERGAPARRVRVPALPGFGKAEGVSPAVVAGRELVVIVSDDGDRDAGRFAGYLLLDPAQLQIAA